MHAQNVPDVVIIAAADREQTVPHGGNIRENLYHTCDHSLLSAETQCLKRCLK
jgi:hypothetical protein